MSTIAKIPSAVGQSQENCKFVLTTNKAIGSVSVEEVGVRGQRQALNEDEFVVCVGSYELVM
jgi:hypothetical protein